MQDSAKHCSKLYFVLISCLIYITAAVLEMNCWYISTWPINVVGGRVEIDTLEPRTCTCHADSVFWFIKLQWFCGGRWWCGRLSLYRRQWHCGDNIVSSTSVPAAAFLLHRSLQNSCTISAVTWQTCLQVY